MESNSKIMNFLVGHKFHIGDVAGNIVYFGFSKAQIRDAYRLISIKVMS